MLFAKNDTCKKMDKSQKYYASEKNQSQKSIFYMVPSIWHSGKGKTMGPEIRPVITRNEG